MLSWQESGPGPSDLSTIAYAYTSSVDLVGDINAGLMGPIVIGNLVSLNSIESVQPLIASQHTQILQLFETVSNWCFLAKG